MVQRIHWLHALNTPAFWAGGRRGFAKGIILDSSSVDDELKKKIYFQIMNIVRFFKNDGGYFTRYMLEKITDSCLSVKDEKFSFLPNYKNT